MVGNNTIIVTAVINNDIEIDVEINHDVCPGDRWTPPVCASSISDYGTSSKKYRQIIDENEERLFEAEDRSKVYLFSE